MSPDGFKGKTWGPSTVHQRERCHLNTAIHSSEWHAANVKNNSAFSKSAPNLDKKAAIRQQKQQNSCNTSPSSPNNCYNTHHSLHQLNSSNNIGSATSPTTQGILTTTVGSSTLSLSSPGTSCSTASMAMVSTIHPAFVTLIQNNQGNNLIHSNHVTSITSPTTSNSLSLASHPHTSNNFNSKNNINFVVNSSASSQTNATTLTCYSKANDVTRLSKKQLKKKHLITKSHDGGLDSLLSKKPNKPLPFECPLQTYDTDRESITPTVVGCFPFRRNTSQLPLSHDKSPVNDLKQSNSLGNSPAIGRKKFSLDSRLSPLAKRQQLSYISPDISPLVGENPFITSCSQQGSLMLIDSNPDNATYDRFFYTSLQKSLDEIFSTSCVNHTKGLSNSPKVSKAADKANYWQKTEPISSKSSVNLTMYSSTSQLTEDVEEIEDPESPYYRFQRNGSGSQFPRHCFFRKPSNAYEKAQLMQNYHQKPATQTPDNNSSFRSYHSNEEPFNSFNSVDNSSQDNSLNSEQTSRKSSVVTFHLNNSSNSSQNNSSILNSVEDYQNESTNNSIQNHSFSFATYYSDSDNSRHIKDSPFTAENSIMAQRKLQDVQPDPEVIQMKQQLLQQQLLQQQQALSLPHKTKDKVKKCKGGKNSQPSISSLEMGTQSHSSNSAKFKTLISFFSLGTLTRSKKKSQKSKSSYKLFQNTLDAQRDSIRISPQRTKSCDQLEMV